MPDVFTVFLNKDDDDDDDDDFSKKKRSLFQVLRLWGRELLKTSARKGGR